MRQLDNNKEVSFNVVLNCSWNKTTREKTLIIKEGFPRRTLDLKLCIQQEYSIPACIQCLKFECVTLDDHTPLEFYHIRDGDRIQVMYASEGDVKEILDVLDHMLTSLSFIKSIQPDLTARKISEELDTLIARNVFPSKVNNLAETYFVPCSSDRAETNRTFYVHCGGVRISHKLHHVLLKQPWANMPLQMQHLEHAILRVYWNMTASFSVRMYVLQDTQTLDCIMRSFTRVKLDPDGYLEAPPNPYASRMTTKYELSRITCEVVYKAMGALCK